MTILVGDCRELLKTLPDRSVQCCVTSPPYFGLRDYGTATWDGGDAACDHVAKNAQNDVSPEQLARRAEKYGTGQQDGSKVTPMQYRDICGKCGATRVDNQIGLESSVDAYVAALVDVFREVRRVLADDGTVWINLGDSYANSGAAGGRTQAGFNERWSGKAYASDKQLDADHSKPSRSIPDGLKPKDLIGVPWRVAFALQADGWWLRNDMIWAKPNPMPESVRDRCTRSHEYIFHLAKSARYFHDADAIKEPCADPEHIRKYGDRYKVAHLPPSAAVSNNNRKYAGGNPNGRNKRTVWTITPKPFPGSHFAVMPVELVEPCIKAGTSERGQCAACGKPWVRMVERTGEARQKFYSGASQHVSDNRRMMRNGQFASTSETTGWQASCSCNAGIVPQTVLDPFAGAGTVLLVAQRLGRDAIGIELNPDYARLAEKRLIDDANASSTRRPPCDNPRHNVPSDGTPTLSDLPLFALVAD